MTALEVKAASGHRGRLLVLVGVAIACGLAAYGIWSRGETVVELQQTADDAALPRVQVISPKPGPSERTLALPGTIDAWYEAPIYAQVNGYVTHWYKDYGAPVKAGDLLATIDTPSLDAEFAASKANLAVVEARYKLAEITAKRWSALSGTQAVSQQDVDVKLADAAAQKAQVAAAQQDVARFQAMVAFKRLVAPFDGVVTARRTNVGDYVNAAGGGCEPPRCRDAAVQCRRHPCDAYFRVGAAGIRRGAQAGAEGDADAAAEPRQADRGAVPDHGQCRHAGHAHDRHRTDGGERGRGAVGRGPM